MKKTVYAMAAILLSLVGFTACSEDDDEKEVFDDVTTELTEDVIYSFSYDNVRNGDSSNFFIQKRISYSIVYYTEGYYIPDRRR